MAVDDADAAAIAADATQAATEQTVEAIERAAEKNDDPRVAEVLDEAALHAEKAVARSGWLRRIVTRILGRPRASGS